MLIWLESGLCLDLCCSCRFPGHTFSLVSMFCFAFLPCYLCFSLSISSYIELVSCSFLNCNPLYYTGALLK